MFELESARYKIANQRRRPSKCRDCPAHPEHIEFDPLLTGGFIPPSGPLRAPLILIGISGGDEEEVRGEPLVGPSGRRAARTLAYYMKVHGIKKLDVRKYNVFNCRSLAVGKQGRIINRTPPTVTEMRACASRWLLPELRKTEAKVILCLGSDAYKFLLKNRFDVFGKAIGHRLYVPRKAVHPEGLDKLISSYGRLYETKT